jgi:hypothetical protein
MGEMIEKKREIKEKREKGKNPFNIKFNKREGEKRKKKEKKEKKTEEEEKEKEEKGKKYLLWELRKRMRKYTCLVFLIVYRWLAWHKGVLMQLFHTLKKGSSLAEKYGTFR